MLYIGIDAHKNTTTIYAINEADEVVGRWVIKTSEKELREVVESIPKKIQTKAVIEEAPIACWIRDVIKDHIDEVVICNPRWNHSITMAEQKNDDADALQLARLLKNNLLKPVYHADDDRRPFKELVLSHHKIVKAIVRTKNQLKAVYRSQGVMVSGKGVYSKKWRQKWIEQLSNNNRFICERLYNILDVQKEQKTLTLKAIKEKAKGYPEIERFMSIPGVGIVIATTFSAIIFTPDRFATKSKLWAYCGIGISKRTSAGKPIRGEHLMWGNHYLKSVLKSAALIAIRSKDCCFSIKYRNMLLNGKKSSSACLSVTRAIASTMWAIWRSKEEFNNDKYFNCNISA